jgi:hypothetical protein
MKASFRTRSSQIAAILLVLHGLIEIAGPFLLAAMPHALISFGGLTGSMLEQNARTVFLFGVLWGLARLIAAWGAWTLRKWAVGLGIVLSLVTIVAAVTILPAGVTDTLFSIPVLIFLLYAWFGSQKIDTGLSIKSKELI